MGVFVLKKPLKGGILLLFVTPFVTPTVTATCKIALFEPPFFVAIQELAGIFLVVQTSQNAYHLNAIKQPFEHPLTAIYTPLPLPVIFVTSGKCPLRQSSSCPATHFYPLFRIFRQSFHVLLTPTLPLCHFLAHVVAFRSFSAYLPTAHHFAPCTPLFSLSTFLRFRLDTKKATAAVPFQHPAVAIISTFSPFRLNLIQLPAVQS